MKDQIIIRPAAKRDIESLISLYFAFHEFHVRGRPDRLASLGSLARFDDTEIRQSLHALLNMEDASLQVAVLNGQLIGFAEIYIRQDEQHPLQLGYRYGFLQSLMVLEAYRHQGIGQRLLKAAEAWAGSLGAVEIRLETWEFAGSPLHFYKKRGYQTLKRVMMRKI